MYDRELSSCSAIIIRVYHNFPTRDYPSVPRETHDC